MGDLEIYMDEAFLKRAFSHLGENSLRSVKMITNKLTGEPANYCFLEFPGAAEAQQALLKANGKHILGSQPIKMFKLNYAGYSRENASGPSHSLFVKDLTEEVDDLKLFNVFSQLYPSCQGAKVILDSNTGKSKGFGFVRFGDEHEHSRALTEMQHYRGLGSRPIRVAVATPKGWRGVTASQPMWPQQWPGYAGGWHQDAQQYDYSAAWAAWYAQGGGQQGMEGQYGEMQQTAEVTEAGSDDEALVDPEITVDVEKENKEFMERSEELYSALEASRWHPLDSYLATTNVSSAAATS